MDRGAAAINAPGLFAEKDKVADEASGVPAFLGYLKVEFWQRPTST